MNLQRPPHRRSLACASRGWAAPLPALAVLGLIVVGCAAEEPKKAAPEPPATCAEKWADSPAWSSSDTTALPAASCTERTSGLFACDKRGKVYVCFDCDGLKTTFDPDEGGPGSLKALGVDDAEMAELEKNYTQGCVKHAAWDGYAKDSITDHLLCPEAMAGLKVCRNIDSNVQWWFMSGAEFRRRIQPATLGNSKGTTHTLELPAAGIDVLDIASYGYLACDAVTATKNPGWDLWIESAGERRTLVVDLVEPQKAAAAPTAADFARLADVFTTCAASYGGWE